MKRHTNAYLENVAEKIFNDNECEIPVDIDFLAESMGVDLFPLRGLKQDFGFLGCWQKSKENLLSSSRERMIAR